ncbi:aconitate hydratase AcnA [Nocardiopsis deserti]|uniref:aconitate hydratase AcnA n=1 Tax=Nocardiopsis deserti TaxID=2605988 RepID=UPI001239E6C6|nr:aconitate hydratase AcnA [Nocardiopsis deserti]
MDDSVARTAATAVLSAAGSEFRYVALDRLLTPDELDRTPYTVRVLVENVARRAPEALPAVLARVRSGRGDCEVPFHPNRMMLHDTTCLPTLTDLAALRDTVTELGGDAADVNPVIATDLVVDHSVIAEAHGSAAAFARNLDIDFRRNAERYEFVKWAERSVRGFRVVPPGRGIIHQVNMETLARVVWREDGGGGPDLLHPDVLVATDSHTPMINAIGVLGWGVGGLQAQAAMLGEPVMLNFPEVVGVRLTGSLRSGVTATDLALTLTELLRATGVVDAFVEFCGPGVDGLSWSARAAVANMAPEYGATCAYFPYDREVRDYLRLTGREDGHVETVDAYMRAQGLARDADSPEPRFDRLVEFDLDTVEPCLAGPHRPDQRVPLSRVPASFLETASAPVEDAAAPDTGASPAPASDTEGVNAVAAKGEDLFGEPLPRGPVGIASITSCTNTANPALMIQAGLLAARAMERGLRVKPWVKTTLSPGSRVVVGYLEKAGLMEPLEAAGFHTVGFGCMTCIGNSGPLVPELEELAGEGLEAAAVLSGNRNFPGRVNPRVSHAYLASPPLVVAYALAGTVLHDFAAEPLGRDRDGNPVHLADLWPDDEEVARVAERAVDPQAFRENAAEVWEGTEQWRALDAAGSTHFPWNGRSTYIRRPPYLTGVRPEPGGEVRVEDARVLLWLGDHVTTDHISPAGAIPRSSLAGAYLRELGTEPRDLNQYSTRRSNAEVMLRGAFTNLAVANLLLPEDERGRGGHARVLDGSRVEPVFHAAATYREAGVDLVVLAGRSYGTGSSRDVAAKVQALLGVRAVIAESFERIHRSNLIGMGVLPLLFPEGSTAADLELDGSERLTVLGLGGIGVGVTPLVLRATKADGSTREYTVLLRLDSGHEVAYLRHGGTMPYVARRFADRRPA